jgi:hypothetical protein
MTPAAAERPTVESREELIMKFAFLLVMAAACAVAQSSNGYVFVAPGGVTSYGHTAMTLHFGGGLDAIVYKGIGLNAELGALGPREDLGASVGVFSAGGAYYFRHARELKLEPFVNGGYSLMFRQGHENLFYCGGGVNYWLARRVGLRFELRDHVDTRYQAVHFWGVRFGISFR